MMVYVIYIYIYDDEYRREGDDRSDEAKK